MVSVARRLPRAGATGYTESDLVELLRSEGSDQQELFEAARRARSEIFADEVVLQAVCEVTNVCRVNCLYCPMRRDNTRTNTTFVMSAGELEEAARNAFDAGVGVLFVQGGEIPQTTAIVSEAAARLVADYGSEVEISLNLGIKSRGEYLRLREAGCCTYVLKHETSDAALNLRMREEELEVRLQGIAELSALGYRVGTGCIVGLPGQSLESLARDILLAARLGVHVCSASPFVPVPDTPLAGHPPGSVDLTLNVIAAMRLVEPRWLVPSVAPLEQLRPEGQLLGLEAGANMITSNFTPPDRAGDYLIYGRERFVVGRDHALTVIDAAGLRPRRSIFTGSDALTGLWNDAGRPGLVDAAGPRSATGAAG